MGNHQYHALVSEEDLAFRTFKDVLDNEITHRPYSLTGRKVTSVETSEKLLRFSIKGEQRYFYYFKYGNRHFNADNNIKIGALVTIRILPIYNISFRNLPYLLVIRIT